MAVIEVIYSPVMVMWGWMTVTQNVWMRDCKDSAFKFLCFPSLTRTGVSRDLHSFIHKKTNPFTIIPLSLPQSSSSSEDQTRIRVNVDQKNILNEFNTQSDRPLKNHIFNLIHSVNVFWKGNLQAE